MPDEEMLTLLVVGFYCPLLTLIGLKFVDLKLTKIIVRIDLKELE